MGLHVIKNVILTTDFVVNFLIKLTLYGSQK